MPKVDHLLPLIQSLSPSEVRYFKLFSSLQGGEKQYLKLFDLLAQRKDYNTKDLSTELGITVGRLAVVKNYLTQSLLTALRNYDEDGADKNAVYTGVDEARLLSNRGLYEHALEVIEKTLAKAWEFEQFESVDQLLMMQYVCLFNRRKTTEMYASLSERRKVAAILAEYREINELATDAARFEWERQPGAQFKKLLLHPLMQKQPEQLLSLRAASMWFSIVYRCQTLESDIASLIKSCRHELDFYSIHPNIKMSDPVAYLVSYTRLATSEFGAHNYENAYKVITEFEQLLENTELQLRKARVASFKTYADAFTCYVLSKLNRFDKALARAEKMQAYIKQRAVYEQISHSYITALCLLQSGKPDKALTHLDQLLSLNTDQRLDLQKSARLLNILAHIDLGNYTLIPYQVKSAREWTKRYHLKEDDYDLFFSTVARITKYPSAIAKQQTINSLHQICQTGQFNQIDESTSINYWVEKRVKGKAK